MKLPAVLLAALLVGNGGMIGYQTIRDPRPDPWTGSDARNAHEAMEDEWHKDLDRVINRVDTLEERMDQRFDRLQNIILDRHE